MKFVEVFENQKLEYNRFVEESETGSFLQCFEWGEWQKNLGREVVRFFIKNEHQDILASLLLVKMRLPFNKYYLYAPYGPVLEHNFQFSISNFQKCVKEKFSEAVFIRIEPKKWNMEHESLSKLVVKSPNIQPGKTLIIDLFKSEEQLLAEMHHKTRYNIRLAEKHGVEVRSDLAVTPGHGLYFQEVVDQVTETESRQRYKGHGAEYYKKMVDFFAMQNNSEIKIHIYKALYQGELLASGIMLDYAKTRTYLFGGSSEKNKNLMAPYLLHFQAMQDAKKNNLTVYDFWGTETSSGKTPGFARFKMGFGGAVKEYAGAFDIPINPYWYMVYKLVKKCRF